MNLITDADIDAVMDALAEFLEARVDYEDKAKECESSPDYFLWREYEYLTSRREKVRVAFRKLLYEVMQDDIRKT